MYANRDHGGKSKASEVVSAASGGKTAGSMAIPFADHRSAGIVQLKQTRLTVNKKAITNDHSHGNEVAQLKPMKKAVTGITHLVKLVDGSLYNAAYESNEIREVREGDMVVIDTDNRYRSRRGPNQETYHETDKQGPQHYLWYKVISLNDRPVEEDTYIREDTITNLHQEAATKEPLPLNIYGSDKSTKNEISEAYREGQRYFDCAYEYHGGDTYKMFRSFKIDRGPVMLIYKFKLQELTGASTELAKLARTEGIIIHTIMLHQLPDTDKEIKIALNHLALLGKTYHSLIGISNVSLSDVAAASNLPELEKQLRKKGVKLSMIENRMNPAVPDLAVLRYCRQHGIKYLAYGLTGPSSGGTCGAAPGIGTGDYKYLSDPEMADICRSLHISVDDFRYVVYTWARQRGAHVITRSSDQQHRARNQQDIRLTQEAEQGINYFAPSAHAIYLPFIRYLTKKGIAPRIIHQLPDYISPGWLELYYKKTIVELNEDHLLKLLASDAAFEKLKSAPGKNRWSDLSAMRIWITTIWGNNLPSLPSHADANQMIDFVQKNDFKIWNRDADTEYKTPADLTRLKPGDLIAVMKKQDVFYYKMTKGGVFELSD